MVCGSNLCGGKHFSPPCTRPNRSCGPPSRLYTGYRFSFLGRKAAGACCYPPTGSTAKVQEKKPSAPPLVFVASYKGKFTFYIKGKDKGNNKQKSPGGGLRYSCTLSITSALDVGGRSTCHGRFIPGEETRYPLS